MFGFDKFRFGQNQKKPDFQSPEERKVTDRTYKQYLKNFCLSEEELSSKKILDIGSGLSDFSVETSKKFQESGVMVVGMDPIYSFLGSNVKKFKKNIIRSNMDWKSFADRSGNLEPAYEKIKEAPYKVSGSHQNLPFKEESFDLVLANNSITQYKDREITRNALKEAVMMIKEDGEIRIQPANLRGDWGKKCLYMHTFEAPTLETREEANQLGLEIGPDREVFDIFKELESAGFQIYATVKEHMLPLTRKYNFQCSIIIRKDDQSPNVLEAKLRKLSFKDSTDNFHIPSTIVISENLEK
ncbi:MAG: methyltransferase domain-containing protein [Parcubacteria group bacterium]|jgi:ubiquinone/menaquinone biosynthesis C-methylase UbiE